MNPFLKKIKDIQAEACVTIICTTHRTHPDNVGDELRLKNLVKNAEERLYNDYEKRFVWPIMENINSIVEKIDHKENLESLIIFANQDMADFTRLAVNVTDRVVVDDTFATRDLVRAEHEQEAYYVLVLSRNEARLMEAMNDKPIQEIKGAFPYKNGTLFNTNKAARHTGGSDEKLIEEFFNRVDKEVQAATKDHPLPVFVISEERNFQHFMKVADRKHMYVSNVAKDRGVENAQIHHIVADVWPEVHEFNREKNERRIVELRKAVGAGKFLSDYNDIWRAIGEGRGETLFVQKGHFQPGLIAGNEIMLVDQLDREQKGVCDDVIDEMIENNLSFGGDTVFVETDDLAKFQGLALTTRF